VLELESRCGALEVSVHLLQQERAIVGVTALEPATDHSGELVSLVSEEGLEHGIDMKGIGLQVPIPHADLAGAYGGDVALLADAECVLRGAPFRALGRDARAMALQHLRGIDRGAEGHDHRDSRGIAERLERAADGHQVAEQRYGCDGDRDELRRCPPWKEGRRSHGQDNEQKRVGVIVVRDHAGCCGGDAGDGDDGERNTDADLARHGLLQKNDGGTDDEELNGEQKDDRAGSVCGEQQIGEQECHGRREDEPEAGTDALEQDRVISTSDVTSRWVAREMFIPRGASYYGLWTPATRNFGAEEGCYGVRVLAVRGW
jgi:hypothetical protein